MASVMEENTWADVERQRLTVTGVVQGVGFRPFVYTLAQRYKLAGFVGNDSGGVFIEIEGPGESIARFRESLATEPPPLAHIEEITADSLQPRGESQFTIVHSNRQEEANTLISPDVCVCDDCLQETLNPLNRRYRYPFTNCTNCGPRFTIIQDIPYDRPLTTMANFTMCEDCQAEYDDPLDRRFHAQPNACRICGPEVWLSPTAGKDNSLRGDEAIQATQSLLADGKIAGIKGLGGFHLACDATDDKALELLRDRKGRVDKPFAVMALDLETVGEFATASDAELVLLSSLERPIVLLKKRVKSVVSDLVAPGNRLIGAMLPYTPLHYLLLIGIPLQLPVLVMTSGNYSDEPIVKDNDEATERLGKLADAFLFHNRDIEARCDDSVIRVWRGTELPVRRSRGYAPFPVQLPATVPPILAVGGELKSTFCLAAEQHAFMSQHIGDMENLETLEAFETAVKHFKHVFRLEPELVACDMHPRYLSTRWAQGQETPVVQIQHHHAHIAAVLAENQIPAGQPVIGFSFDGTGYGQDGAIWGGEILVGDYQEFERVAHLKYAPLPGGDTAIKRPYRLALAYLWSVGEDWDERLAPVRASTETERTVLRRQLEVGINTVPTSSMGRLFDVVASLTGIRHTITYEAQAAIELESMADPGEVGSYGFALSGDVIDLQSVILSVVRDVFASESASVISARFHNSVADLIRQISVYQREQTGISQVALSGGVFQNVTLLEKSVRLLEEANFDVLIHRKVPPNDGGLALGQAMIAAHTET